MFDLYSWGQLCSHHDAHILCEIACMAGVVTSGAYCVIPLRSELVPSVPVLLAAWVLPTALFTPASFGGGSRLPCTKRCSCARILLCADCAWQVAAWLLCLGCSSIVGFSFSTMGSYDKSSNRPRDLPYGRQQSTTPQYTLSHANHFPAIMGTAAVHPKFHIMTAHVAARQPHWVSLPDNLPIVLHC